MIDWGQKLNPFTSERRILVFWGTLLVFNFALYSLNDPSLLRLQDERLRELSPTLYRITLWLDTPVGIAVTLMVFGSMFWTYHQALRNPGHWLNRRSFGGIRGPLFFLEWGLVGSVVLH